MPADTVEVVVKLTGLATVQAGMRRLREAVTGPLEMAAGRMRGFALSIGSTLLAGLSVYRVGAELKQALGDMDKAAEAGQKLGIVADELTALDYAATISESSAEELHNALKFLAKAAESNSDAFATLGIEIKTADGHFRPHRDLLADIAQRFAAMPNGVEKTTLALELFGKQGLSMIPMLNSGADGIREMMDEARAFGLVVAPDAAAGANALNDNFQKLHLAVQGLARTALAELLPVLLDLTNRLIEWIKQNDLVRRGAELLAEAMRYIIFDVQFLIVTGRVWWRTWMVYLDALAKAFVAFGRLVARVWEQPIEIIRAWIEYMKVALRAMGELAQAMVLVAQGHFGEAKDKAKTAGIEIAQAMKTLASSVLSSWGETGDALLDAFTTPYEGATRTAETFIEEGKKGFEELQRAFASIWFPAPLPHAPETGRGTDLELDPADDRRKRIARELREAEYELRRRRQAVADEMARLDSDFGTREADKYQKRIALLREEIGLIDREIERLRERLAVEKDADVRENLSQSMRGLESERHGVQTQLNRVENAPDPYSYRDQMLATMTELENQMGTTAESVARQFGNVIGSAIDGVQQGIEGLIKGTMDWGDALRNIGSSIINGVISAISRMFAEWIVKRALMAAKNIAFSTSEGAADAAAKAPGALMSSISSYGVAALVGTAALIAAIAAISGTFAEGGIVRGPGGPKDDAILARLSNGEGVLNAAAVRHYGAGVVNAMNNRTAQFYAQPQGAGFAQDTRAPGTTAAGSASPSGRSAAVNLVLVDDRKHAKDFIASSEGEALIMDIVRRKRVEVGIPS